MSTSSRSFIKWFLEYYKHEFTKIPYEEKKEIIKEVLPNNFKYITKKDIIDFDGCIQCGDCCRQQHCPHINSNNLCERHDDPIDELCISYPWSGDLGVMPLLLNCDYQVAFFVSYFDKVFQDIENRGVKYE